MTWRDETLNRIKQKPDVSVLILGAGINGVGVYRDLALQGVDCLLVDKADIAAGATSKSSRMIHGGLRYLENGEFRLVRESLTERNRLLDNACHYVTPLQTTIPLFSWLAGLVKSPLLFFGVPVKPGGRGALIVKLGLSFYDFITRKTRKTPTHYLLSKAKSLAEVPGIHPDIVGTATYWDARITQAERLCVELIQDARRDQADGAVLTYTDVLRTEKDTVWMRDQASGDEIPVRPKVVVNATGAWVDLANAALGAETSFMGGTKGSHLVVDNEALRATLGDRMVYYEHADGRICIVSAFMGKVIMGSTDIRVDDPDTADCDNDEIDYMLDTLRGVFPDIPVSRDEVVYTFCGVRPLPAANIDTPGKISRDHHIEALEPDDRRAFPVLCLIGGKWTTFRALGEQTADQVLGRIGRTRSVSTEQLPIGGAKACPVGEAERTRWIERIAAETKLPSTRVAVLLDRYGASAEAYARSILEADETPLVSLPDYTVGEIEQIAENEFVEHLTDVVCRRSLVAILGEGHREALEEIADVVGISLGWSPERKEDEVAAALADAQV